jgi:hypothetical protein
MDINAFPSLHVAISSLISLLIGKKKESSVGVLELVIINCDIYIPGETALFL